MIEVLRTKPILKKTWQSVTFFYQGERITWYFWRGKFHWETGYNDEMWYDSFDELVDDIEDFEETMRDY